MPSEPGPCVNYMTRWYFSRESGRCEPFTYGGCQGNRNKFLTEQECTAECGGGEPVPTDPPSTPAPPSPVEPSQGEKCVLLYSCSVSFNTSPTVDENLGYIISF